MAGAGAVIEGWRNGLWYQCSDGKVLDALDLVGLLFPNKGRNTTEYNQCFVPRHFTFAPLRALLPDPDPAGYFAPDDLVDTVISLLILCVLVTVGFVVCKIAWERLDPSFAAISPSHKKWYVVANLSKALFLAILTSSRRFWIAFYLRFYLDEFDSLNMKRFSMTYAVTDLVALYMVPKLPRSTIMHHIVTTIVCLMMSATDMTVKGGGGFLGVAKMSMLYGMCSTVTFTVNAYLAFRVVYPKAPWLTTLVNTSLWTYVACCAMNWSAHAFWLLKQILTLEISLASLLYLIPVIVMVNDDIILMKWLIKRSSPAVGIEKDN